MEAEERNKDVDRNSVEKEGEYLNYCRPKAGKGKV